MSTQQPAKVIGAARASLLVKARKAQREIVAITPESAGWRYVGFAAYQLKAGESLSLALEQREACVVVLAGIASVSRGEASYREIGQRQSVFDDAAPYAVYLPPGAPISVLAHTAAQIAIGTAPATGKLPARLIEPPSMRRFQRGKDLNSRMICDILPQTEAAESLLLTEVRTASGHSSSYPPHKHDRDMPPEETFLEETYYHRLNPPQGFAFQRVYTDDRSLDESMAVEDHDVVLVPRGYHPVVVPYGYESYYLNVMAGPRREWCFKNDPAHEWIVK